MVRTAALAVPSVVKVTGGTKLDAALAEIATKASSAARVEVGFLENATYPSGEPVAMVAAIQEFGAPARNIPPRPFFRGMINEKSGQWPNAVADLLKANDFDAAKTLAQAGDGIAGQLRQSIASFAGEPLAPATVAAKGSSKQLVDTGHMLNSVDYRVEE